MVGEGARKSVKDCGTTNIEHGKNCHDVLGR